MAEKESTCLNVLLVHSDHVAARLFKISFEDKSPIPSSIDRAYTPDDALHRIQEKRYDAFIIETDFEDESGMTLLKQIRDIHRRAPLILMTSNHDEVLKEQAIRAGASDLIIKDENNVEDIIERVTELSKQMTKNRRRRALDLPGQELHVRDEKLSGETAEKKSGSSEDELTGLYTHSYLHDRVLIEYSRVTRYQYPLSCLILDIDHFKGVNEKYGYHVGDALLKQCANILFQHVRLSDIVARYGGEEFAILMPHTGYEGAKHLALRLRALFAEHLFVIEGKEINLTVSIGISSYPEDQFTHCSEIMEFANQALFRSKAIGRNSVTCYKDVVPTFGGELPDLKISESKILEFQRSMTDISNLARKAYVDASRAMIIALESKDKFTAGHAASCGKYCLLIARAMGMPTDDAEVIQHAALLHDIGKICIPDNILLKPAKLSFAEYEQMKQHPYLGYKILKPIKFLQQESLMVLHHHEWFNGKGYPCRLTGYEIPLGSRIISVVDAYDTMRVSGGRYKKTMTVDEGISELVTYAGTQFDPHVVKTFIAVLKTRGELVTESYDKNHLETMIERFPPEVPKTF